jgi:hypothetical protein
VARVHLNLLVTYSHEKFSELQAYWSRHSRSGQAGTRRRENDHSWGGQAEIIDWQTKEICARASVPRARGAFIQAGKFVICGYNGISVHDSELRREFEVTNPLFCNLQTVDAYGSGYVVASSGIDSILKVSADFEVSVLWHGPADGYGQLRDGTPRTVDLAEDHRARFYSTLEQTTHVNGAVHVRSRDSVVATLFHQGELIHVDSSGVSRVLADGFSYPHCPRIRDDEVLYFADTRAGGIVECSLTNLKPTRRIDLSTHSPWIQSIRWIPQLNAYLVADSNNRRILEVSDEGVVVDSWDVGRDWRIYDIALVS